MNWIILTAWDVIILHSDGLIWILETFVALHLFKHSFPSHTWRHTYYCCYCFAVLQTLTIPELSSAYTFPVKCEYLLAFAVWNVDVVSFHWWFNTLLTWYKENLCIKILIWYKVEGKCFKSWSIAQKDNLKAIKQF